MFLLLVAATRLDNVSAMELRLQTEEEATSGAEVLLTVPVLMLPCTCLSSPLTKIRGKNVFHKVGSSIRLWLMIFMIHDL